MSVTTPGPVMTWKVIHHTAQGQPRTQNVSATLASGVTCPPVGTYDPDIKHPAVDQNYLPAISGG